MNQGLITPPGFSVIDRPAWAALGPGRPPDATAARAAAFPPADSPVSDREWEEVYVPLGHVVGLHVDAHGRLGARLSAVGLGARTGPLVIGLAGSVAAGKSTFATALAALLSARPDRPSVEVLSTDGFLLANRVLAPRGLLARKGFPETYDHELVARVLGALAAGAPEVAVPRYSHDVYDVAGDPQVLSRPDIVILEGVNTLAPGRPGAPVEPADFCALRIYLDAAEPDLRAWYVERFVALIDEARGRPTSFFAQWASLDASAARALAASVWEQVNLVNLTEHILPTRWRADLVLRKDADHAVAEVAVRHR